MISKYSLIQTLVFLFEIFVFAILISIFPSAVISNIISKISVSVLSYPVHARYSFANSSIFSKKKISCYFFLLILNIPISSLTIFIYELIFQNGIISKIFSDLSIFLFNFLFLKKLVFINK